MGICLPWVLLRWTDKDEGGEIQIRQVQCGDGGLCALKNRSLVKKKSHTYENVDPNIKCFSGNINLLYQKMIYLHCDCCLINQSNFI